MASKAYIASMTVAELSSELKKRGLSCRGKKKTLQSRLEEALENEELSESSSDDGREATIRAASAVISQLEGDTSGNNFNMAATTNTTLTTPLLQEELVVSIEHSRRLTQQTENARNGDDELLQSGGKSPGSMDKCMPKDEPMVPKVDHIPPSTTEHQTKNIVHEENQSSSIPATSAEVPTRPEQPNTLPVEQVSVQSQQDGKDTNTPQDQVKGTDESVTPQPSTPSDSPSSRPKQQQSPNAPRVLPLPNTGTTPTIDRSGFLVPPTGGFMSPLDTDVESEVNSVAVEPPSPNRDDVSFAADEGNMSVCGSVDLMDTSVSGGGDVPEDSTPVQTKVIPTEVSTPPGSKPDIGQQKQTDVDKVRQEDEQVGVSSQSGLDSGTIELDVLVPTVEEEDMSVFSAEAAEVQKLDNKVLEKPGTLFENNGVDTTTTTSMRSLSASDRTTESVGGVLDSCTNGSKKRAISASEESREDRERSGTPSTKRRRISTSPKRAQERRRKWGSSTSRTPTAAPTAISSDILENIIPDEVKEEVSEQTSGLDAVMIYDDETNTEIPTEKDKKEEELKVVQGEQQSTEQQPMDVGGEEDGDETKPVEEEDILDLGKESSMVDEYEQEWKEKEQEREEQRKESLKAKQELETRRRIEARVRARQQQEKLEEKDKQPVVRRTPSPARNPPSRMLHIVNLTRPFTNTQLKDLLQDGEDVLVEKGCWTDRIKSHCIAVFLTMESAIAARNRIHNLKWPRQNPRLLKADYLTPKEVYEFSNGELEIQASTSDNEQDEKMIVDEEQITTKEVHEPVQKQYSQQNNMVDKRRESVQEKRDHAEATRIERLPSSNDKEELKEEKKPKSMLDKLFRKTQAAPPIYWLPLTEKEVKEKEAQHAAEEMERQKRREERRKERELEEQAREKKLREEREERARERMRRRRERSDSRSRSPRYRRRTPIRRGHSPRRSRSPVRRRRSTRSRSRSPR